jgi:hypothetical protein
VHEGTFEEEDAPPPREGTGGGNGHPHDAGGVANAAAANDDDDGRGGGTPSSSRDPGRRPSIQRRRFVCTLWDGVPCLGSRGLADVEKPPLSEC